MEPKDSLQCSQEATTGPYHETDESSPHLQSYFRGIHFNIIFSFTPNSSKWYLSFRFSDQNLYTCALHASPLSLSVNLSF
jgi:hypothetical protein